MTSTTTAARRSRREDRIRRRRQPAAPVVWPGMRGGAFRPLRDADIPRIHEAALEVLARTGISDVEERYRKLMVANGCTVGGDGRVRIPGSLVEDMLAVTPKKVTIHGQDRDRTVEFGDRRVHVCTGGSGVNIFDGSTGAVRQSTLADLYDVTRLADAMDNIHCCNRQLVPRDISVVEDADINTAYALVSGTRKPFGAGVTTAESAGKVRRLMDLVLGDDEAFDREPICWSGGTFVISPLRAPADGQEKLEAIIRAGFPLHQVMVPQSGTTGPAPLAGTLVQCLAESLFVVCLVQMIKPGHPFIVGCWPFVSDLRTGGFSGGNGEQALLMAASAQLMSYYGLPSSIAAGMSDSKLTDVQAGFEKGITLSFAAAAGPTLIYSFAGMLGSIMGIAPEQTVIDNEIIGQSLRVLRGIEVTDDTLSVDVIAESSVGPGHYMAHPQTLRFMESEYLYPKLADRSSVTEWASGDLKGIRGRAQDRANEILSEHFPTHISREQDSLIRTVFNIRLDPQRMLRGA